MKKVRGKGLLVMIALLGVLLFSGVGTGPGVANAYPLSNSALYGAIGGIDLGLWQVYVAQSAIYDSPTYAYYAWDMMWYAYNVDAYNAWYYAWYSYYHFGGGSLAYYAMIYANEAYDYLYYAESDANYMYVYFYDSYWGPYYGYWALYNGGWGGAYLALSLYYAGIGSYGGVY